MTHILFVVSRNQLDLLPALRRETRAGNAEVIIDRRRSDRRQKADPARFPDLRRAERRVRQTTRDLELIGIAVVILH